MRIRALTAAATSFGSAFDRFPGLTGESPAGCFLMYLLRPLSVSLHPSVLSSVAQPAPANSRMHRSRIWSTNVSAVMCAGKPELYFGRPACPFPAPGTHFARNSARADFIMSLYARRSL